MADLARDIQSMLEKLTDDEKAAFNFLIGLSRQQPPVARSYTITLRQAVLPHYTEHVTTEREVWAYDRDEAVKQMQQMLSMEPPPTDLNLDRPYVRTCTPTIPKGTE